MFVSKIVFTFEELIVSCWKVLLIFLILQLFHILNLSCWFLRDIGICCEHSILCNFYFQWIGDKSWSLSIRCYPLFLSNYTRFEFRLFTKKYPPLLSLWILEYVIYIRKDIIVLYNKISMYLSNVPLDQWYFP